jgi:hypothetical protein
MQKQSLPFRAVIVLLSVGLSACSGSGRSPTLPARESISQGPSTMTLVQAARGRAVGPGQVVTSKFGGQIFGWDMNENGDDGVLTECVITTRYLCKSVVETFDQNAATITNVVATQRSVSGSKELVVGGIAANDVGLVDDERDDNGTRRDVFHTVVPVKGGRFTGRWNPPVDRNFLLEDVADQQTDPNVAILGYLNHIGGGPEIVVTNLASNTILAKYRLSNHEIYTGLYILAQDTTLNEAYVPVLDSQGMTEFIDVDLASGRKKILPRVPVGRGGALGIAIDSSTDVMCTTTADDYSVEFYDLKTGKGIAEVLPGAGGQQFDGGPIAADPVNHLFLVGQPVSSQSGGSTIYVYGEDGTLFETLNGFIFGGNNSVGPSLHVNGALRTGYTSGPRVNSLQQFSY